MNGKSCWHWGPVAGGLLLVALLGWFTTNSGVQLSSASSTTTFSGQATVVKATVPLFGTFRLVGTGPLPSSGGAAHDHLAQASVPGLLTAEVLHASAIAQGNASRSEASVASLDLTVADNSIGADFVMARAEATCDSTSSSSELVNLNVNGTSIVVGTAPNQRVDLPVGFIITNEQTSSTGAITVNAIHVVVPGVADVIISSAHADISCAPEPTATPSPTPCNDFMTGGGWIGNKNNFGVAGGINNGAFWGHLNYQDKAAGLHAQSHNVTGYETTGPTSRRISYDGGAYVVEVADNGEPGRGDTFSITSAAGYSASGTLSQGGNIQLHKCR